MSSTAGPGSADPRASERSTVEKAWHARACAMCATRLPPVPRAPTVIELDADADEDEDEAVPLALPQPLPQPITLLGPGTTNASPNRSPKGRNNGLMPSSAPAPALRHPPRQQLPRPARGHVGSLLACRPPALLRGPNRAMPQETVRGFLCFVCLFSLFERCSLVFSSVFR